MALVFTKLDQDDVGGQTEEVECLMSADTVYPTGGYTLDASIVPFRCKVRVDSIEHEAHPTFAFQYDRTDDKSGQLLIYQAAGGLTELPNGTDLSALSVRCTIKGR